jgi:hypothetical protein
VFATFQRITIVINGVVSAFASAQDKPLCSTPTRPVLVSVLIDAGGRPSFKLVSMPALPGNLARCALVGILRAASGSADDSAPAHDSWVCTSACGNHGTTDFRLYYSFQQHGAKFRGHVRKLQWWSVHSTSTRATARGFSGYDWLSTVPSSNANANASGP